MKWVAQWLVVVAWLSSIQVVVAQAEPTDPVMERALAQKAPAAGLPRHELGPRIAQPEWEEPPESVLSRSQGLIRGAAPIAAISAAFILGWSALDHPHQFSYDSCGGLLTPMLMATPLIIGTVLTALGIARTRALRRQGVRPYPISPGRRATRVLGTFVGAAAVTGIGAGMLALDAICTGTS